MTRCAHEFTVIDRAHGWTIGESSEQPRWTCVRCLTCNATGPRIAGYEQDAGLRAQVAWFGMLGLAPDHWPVCVRSAWDARQELTP